MTHRHAAIAILFLFGFTALPAAYPQIPPRPSGAILGPLAGQGICNIRDFGAIPDARTLDTVAINRAVAACVNQGGGTVMVPAGVYLTGTIRLYSHIRLHLDMGARLLGSPHLRDYPAMATSSENRNTALIIAEGAHDVVIDGPGTIDGNSAAFTDNGLPHYDPFFDPLRTREGAGFALRMHQARQGPEKMKPRPGVLLLLLHDHGVVLRNFHIRNSPNWGVKILCSRNILVRGLDARNSMRVPNSDALDVSNSQDAIISDSRLEAGDDALVVGGVCGDAWCRQLPTRNVTVSNMILRSRSAAIRIGPNAAGASHLIFSNIVIHRSNRGIMVQARDAETLAHLLFSNITISTHLMDGPWWGSGEPITLTVAKWAYPAWDPPSPSIPNPGMGMIRQVRFSHIQVNSTSPIVLYSTLPGRIQDVRFDDLSLTLRASPLQTILGGNLDLQPTTPRADGVVKHDLSGILIRNVQNLALDHVRVRWQSQLPDFYRSAITAWDFAGLRIQDFQGRANLPGLAAICLGPGSGEAVTDSSSSQGPLLGYACIPPAHSARVEPHKSDAPRITAAFR